MLLRNLQWANSHLIKPLGQKVYFITFTNLAIFALSCIRQTSLQSFSLFWEKDSVGSENYNAYKEVA